jgi:hypothetical protein
MATNVSSCVLTFGCYCRQMSPDLLALEGLPQALSCGNPWNSGCCELPGLFQCCSWSQSTLARPQGWARDLRLGLFEILAPEVPRLVSEPWADGLRTLS